MRPLYLYIISLLLTLGCTEYTPKPRGYFRIEPLQAKYEVYEASGMPCAFWVSNQAKVEETRGGLQIAYPALQATLYCTYIPTRADKLADDIRESRSLVARQAERAEKISERAYENPEAGVYGLLFLIEGETAAPVQFALTDSVARFFRGALYYGCEINPDSLQPVTDYLRKDVEAMIESFRWK